MTKPIRIRQYWLGTSPAYSVHMNGLERYVGLTETQMKDLVTRLCARLRHVD